MYYLSFIRLFAFVFSCVFFSHLLLSETAQNKRKIELAVLGDDFSSGLHAEIESFYDEKGLLSLFTDKKNSANSAPIYLWPNKREAADSLNWVLENFSHSIRRYFTTKTDSSWGAFLAKQLKISFDDTVISADSNMRVRELPRLVDRLFAYTKGTVPAKIFIMLGSADICALKPSLVTESSAYRAQLLRGLKYLIHHASPTEHTDIYIVDPMNTTQIVTKKELLNKEIPYYGKRVSCEIAVKHGFNPPADQLKQSVDANSEFFYFNQFFTETPARLCPTLFSRDTLAQSEVSLVDVFSSGKKEKVINRSIENQLSRLALLTREYRKENASVVKEMADWLKAENQSNIFIHHINSIALYDIQSEEISSDCYHLNEKGNKVIADLILKDI